MLGARLANAPKPAAAESLELKPAELSAERRRLPAEAGALQKHGVCASPATATGVSLFRKTLALFVFVAALALCGCSGETDTGVARFVEPSLFGGEAIFSGKPELSEPLPVFSHEENLAESDTIYTKNCRWRVEGERFVCEEFTFWMDRAWTGKFLCEIVETEVPGYNLRTFKFYYIQDEQTRLRIFSVECRSAGFCERYGEYGGDFLGETEDGELRYFFVPASSEFPQNFKDYAAFMNIYGAVVSDKLAFRVF